MIDKFNIRVYGLWVRSDKVLVTHEQIRDLSMTKFPGGGLHYGEGLHDGLRREFLEETGSEVDILDHFYTTDFFQKSAFSDREQILSVYYRVSGKIEDVPKENQVAEHHHIRFEWRRIPEIMDDELSFPIDRLVVSMLRTNFRSER